MEAGSHVPLISPSANRRPMRGGAKAPTFGLVLGYLRSHRIEGASLDALSRDLAAIGVKAAKSTLSRYETEGRVPDIAVLDGLARVFEVSRESLIDVLLAELAGTAIGDVEAIGQALIARSPALATRPGAEVAAPAESVPDVRLMTQRLDKLERAVETKQAILAEIVASAERIVAMVQTGTMLPGQPAPVVTHPGVLPTPTLHTIDDDDDPQAA